MTRTDPNRPPPPAQPPVTIAVACDTTIHHLTAELGHAGTVTVTSDDHDLDADRAYAALAGTACLCVSIADTLTALGNVTATHLEHVSNRFGPHESVHSVHVMLIHPAPTKFAHLFTVEHDLARIDTMIERNYTVGDVAGYLAFGIIDLADMAANPVTGTTLNLWHQAGVRTLDDVQRHTDDRIDPHLAIQWVAVGATSEHWDTLNRARIDGYTLQLLHDRLGDIDLAVTHAARGIRASDYAIADELGIAVTELVETLGGAEQVTLYQLADLDLAGMRIAAHHGITGTEAVLWRRRPRTGRDPARWATRQAGGDDIARWWRDERLNNPGGH